MTARQIGRDISRDYRSRVELVVCAIDSPNIAMETAGRVNDSSPSSTLSLSIFLSLS